MNRWSGKAARKVLIRLGFRGLGFRAALSICLLHKTWKCLQIASTHSLSGLNNPCAILMYP